MSLLESLSVICVLASVIAVLASYVSWRMASQIRSLRSLQGEIMEIDACVASLLTSIKRIEGRQTARIGRQRAKESPDTMVEPELPGLLDKAEIRARYLVPGQPARHDHGQQRSRDTA